MNDLLTTDNQKDEESSRGYSPNKKDAERVDNFVNSHKSPNGNEVGSSNGSSGSSPSGSNIGNSSMETGGAKPTPKGSNIPTGGSGAQASAQGGSNIAQGASQAGSATAQAGGNAMAQGVAQGTAQGVAQGATTAASVGGTVAAEGGAIAVEGGAAVAAGAPTAGIGAVVVVAASVVINTAGLALKAVKKGAKDISDTMDNKKSSSIGKAPTLLLAILFCILLISIPLLTPAAAFSAVVDYVEGVGDDIKAGVGGKISSYTEKGKFFRALFDADGLGLSDAELYSTVNSQTQVDENNAVIYKAIIDKAISESYDKYVVEFTKNPKVIMQSILGFFHITGYSQKASLMNLKSKPYYYAFGNYTVGDYLNGNVENTDLNYAEILTVFSQGDENIYYSISYSDFYDKLVGNPDAPHLFFEMEVAETPTYFYWEDAAHTKISGPVSKEEAKKHATWRQLLGGWLFPDEYDDDDTSDTTTTEDSSDESDEDSDDDSDSDDDTSDTSTPTDYTEAPVDQEGENYDYGDDNTHYGWGYYYDVTLYPYGLEELYRSAGVNPDGESPINPDFTNLDVLDIQEGYLRQYIGNKVYLGPSYDKERTDPSGNNLTSKWTPLYTKLGKKSSSGRTQLRWCTNSITASVVGYPGSPLGNYGGMDVDYKPNGSSVILDLVEPYYICQWNNPASGILRGDSSTPIGKAACIDCSYMMAAEYYNRETYDIAVISSSTKKGGYVSGCSFQTQTFMNAFGLARHSVSPNSEQIVEELVQGHPIEVQISGGWTGKNGNVYHNPSSEHHFLIVGYDDTGLYLADPGSISNSGSTPIPYDDFACVNIVGLWSITSTNGKGPNYSVNTLK